MSAGGAAVRSRRKADREHEWVLGLFGGGQADGTLTGRPSVVTGPRFRERVLLVIRLRLRGERGAVLADQNELGGLCVDHGKDSLSGCPVLRADDDPAVAVRSRTGNRTPWASYRRRRIEKPGIETFHEVGNRALIGYARSVRRLRHRAPPWKSCRGSLRRCAGQRSGVGTVRRLRLRHRGAPPVAG